MWPVFCIPIGHEAASPCKNTHVRLAGKHLHSSGDRCAPINLIYCFLLVNGYVARSGYLLVHQHIHQLQGRFGTVHWRLVSCQHLHGCLCLMQRPLLLERALGA